MLRYPFGYQDDTCIAHFYGLITDCYLQDSAVHYCLLLNRSLSYFYGLAKPKQCCCVGNVDLMVSKKANKAMVSLDWQFNRNFVKRSSEVY